MKTYKLIFPLLGTLLFCGLVPNAWAQLDVVTNLANSSTPDQQYVKNIFLGKIKVFEDGSRAKPVDLPEATVARSDFYTLLFGKTDMEMKLFWSTAIFTGAGTPPRVLESGQEILKFVRENPGAIGYLPRGMADKSVKILFSVD